MAKSVSRLRAEKLREMGLSISTIAKRVGVSKSSVSLWCRNITLTNGQKEKLLANMVKGGHAGRMIGADINRQRKLRLLEAYKEDGLKTVDRLSNRDLLVAGTCLYWAEGSKTDNRLIFVNSDPKMILLACRYMREILGIKKDLIRITIQINRIHEGRIGEVQNFWSKLLGLPLNQFGKPYYINILPKKVYSNYNEYYGIARLRVLKSSRLQYKVLGLIEAFKKQSLPR